MPNVPNVPGVPALSSYSTNRAVLAVADVFTAVSVLFPVSWGIFVEGIPVITPASTLTQAVQSTIGAISEVAALIGLPNVVPVTASTVQFEYSADAPISSYPQEEGAFQSYDKVQLPFDVRLKLACRGAASQRQAFFNTLEALRTSTTLVDIVTPEKVYSSVNCVHIDWTRRADRGVELIIADAWFEQVRVEAESTFTNTQKPNDAAPQSIGNVQPQTPTSSLQQQFDIRSASAGFF